MLRLPPAPPGSHVAATPVPALHATVHTCLLLRMQVGTIHARFVFRTHARTAFACARFLCLLILQHEAILYHTSETGEIFVKNDCNICNIQMKHLQHTSKIDETF
jgi:hypothetical protein